MIIAAKAVSQGKIWLYGYAILDKGVEKIFTDTGELVEVIPGTVCYRIGGFDKNGRPLYTGDVVNDFGGGTDDDWEVDTDDEDYHPMQALPPMRKKKDGNFTRLGEIVFSGGTIRVRTKELGYDYNIHGLGFGEMEYVKNIHDELLMSGGAAQKENV